MEEATDNGYNLAAPLIFIIIATEQYVTKFLECQINKLNMTDMEVKLRQEIKQLYKEASTFSQPSTFAQAAKLRRNAAAKEKELAKYLEQDVMEKKSSYVPYLQIMTPVKILTYILLTLWYWGSPVASISKDLVQPSGTVLSWTAGARAEGKVMIGIVPWLGMCTCASSIICRKYIH